MHTAVVLFTRDLRVHDNPALAAAATNAEHVVPLFVLDDAMLVRFAAPTRAVFLLEALRDLDASLRALGGMLVVRRGDVVEEAVRCARDARAGAVFLAEDVSRTARSRERRLLDAGLDVRSSPGVTVIPLGSIAPAGRDCFQVFTAYWNRWRSEPRRSVLAPPVTIRVPPGVEPGRIPEPGDPGFPRVATSSGVWLGGETEGRRRLEAWLDGGLSAYDERRDDLAADATSRLSPFLHFGCLSPLQVAECARESSRGEGFVRQLCWRDFNHQLLAARPDAAVRDLRPRGDEWRDDAEALGRWKEGRTGYPLVDAGMRQLRAEGFVHNRARLVVASFLTKHLYLDWRLGAEHFESLLADGDLANNRLNWQWVAGTGADTRPNRVLNPIRQALLYDPRGEYVRRWVPELAHLERATIHEPWLVGDAVPSTYPARIVDHAEAVRRFRLARGLGTR